MTLSSKDCINPIGPGRFCDAYVPGGMFFHPPLKNDFLLQKRVIFHLDIKLGIILALFLGTLQILSSTLTIFALLTLEMT